PAADARRLPPFADAPGLLQVGADEVQPDSVVGSDSRWEAVRDQLLVNGPPPLLAVVMRTRAAGQETEPVAHPFELRPERIRHARLEPADHPGTRPGEHDPLLPGL